MPCCTVCSIARIAPPCIINIRATDSLKSLLAFLLTVRHQIRYNDFNQRRVMIPHISIRTYVPRLYERRLYSEFVCDDCLRLNLVLVVGLFN